MQLHSSGAKAMEGDRLQGMQILRDAGYDNMHHPKMAAMNSNYTGDGQAVLDKKKYGHSVPPSQFPAPTASVNYEPGIEHTDTHMQAEKLVAGKRNEIQRRGAVDGLSMASGLVRALAIEGARAAKGNRARDFGVMVKTDDGFKLRPGRDHDLPLYNIRRQVGRMYDTDGFARYQAISRHL